MKKTSWFLYFPSTINTMERWLIKKAHDGWKLIDKRGWKFVFAKCSPYEAKFFSYSGFDSSRGFSYDYLASKNIYSKSKSIINKSNLEVFEVDLNKIDNGFKILVLLRNKYYLKHYLYLSIMNFFCVLVMLFIVNVCWIILFFLIPLAYSLASAMILFCEIKKTKKT